VCDTIGVETDMLCLLHHRPTISNQSSIRRAEADRAAPLGSAVLPDEA
jgi:hypothetical protein